jgi:hypothetical protein
MRLDTASRPAARILGPPRRPLNRSPKLAHENEDGRPPTPRASLRPRPMCAPALSSAFHIRRQAWAKGFWRAALGSHPRAAQHRSGELGACPSRGRSTRTPTRPSSCRSARPRSRSGARRWTRSPRTVLIELAREKHRSDSDTSRHTAAALFALHVRKDLLTTCATSPPAHRDQQQPARSGGTDSSTSRVPRPNNSSGYFLVRGMTSDFSFPPGQPWHRSLRQTRDGSGYRSAVVPGGSGQKAASLVGVGAVVVWEALFEQRFLEADPGCVGDQD